MKTVKEEEWMALSDATTNISKMNQKKKKGMVRHKFGVVLRKKEKGEVGDGEVQRTVLENMKIIPCLISPILFKT